MRTTMAAAGDNNHNNHNHNSSHDNNYDIDPPAPLIDPSLLAGLSESDRKEALAAAAAAQRAEERAEQRALERALKRKEEERRREREVEEERQEQRLLQKQQQQRQGALSGEEDAAPSLVYVPKRRRLVGDPHTHSSDRNEGGEAEQTNRHESSRSSNGSSANATTTGLKHPNLGNGRRGGGSTGRSKHEETVAAAAAPVLSEREAEYVRKAYLGKSSGLLDAGSAPADASDAKSRRKDVRSKKPTFKFRWDNTDDTAVDDDPLYGSIPAVHNRGAASTAATFQPPTRAYSSQHPPRGGGRGRSGRSGPPPASSAAMDTVLTKPLGAMTSRDWRIFRENYEINVRGGKAPSPLRAFRESNPPLHELIVQALERDLKFREPTPIQRQAIPIGLQRRDLIGLAETGTDSKIRERLVVPF
jgi:ATP-dependent RNA helicase DDX23/PRP28